VCFAAAGLTQMLDYYAGNSYDDGDSITPSSRGARSTTIQVSSQLLQVTSIVLPCVLRRALQCKS
jgi:hypothetical protein